MTAMILSNQPEEVDTLEDDESGLLEMPKFGLIGVFGGQGTGKTTTATKLINLYYSDYYFIGVNIADDFNSDSLQIPSAKRQNVMNPEELKQTISSLTQMNQKIVVLMDDIQSKTTGFIRFLENNQNIARHNRVVYFIMIHSMSGGGFDVRGFLPQLQVAVITVSSHNKSLLSRMAQKQSLGISRDVIQQLRDNVHLPFFKFVVVKLDSQEIYDDTMHKQNFSPSTI